jgi:hypothetical protein
MNNKIKAMPVLKATTANGLNPKRMASLPKIGAIPKNREEEAAAWMPLIFPF